MALKTVDLHAVLHPASRELGEALVYFEGSFSSTEPLGVFNRLLAAEIERNGVDLQIVDRGIDGSCDGGTRAYTATKTSRRLVVHLSCPSYTRFGPLHARRVVVNPLEDEPPSPLPPAVLWLGRKALGLQSRLSDPEGAARTAAPHVLAAVRSFLNTASQLCRTLRTNRLQVRSGTDGHERPERLAWILHLEAGEEINERDTQRLKEFLLTADLDQYEVIVRWELSANPLLAVVYPSPRLALASPGSSPYVGAAPRRLLPFAIECGLEAPKKPGWEGNLETPARWHRDAVVCLAAGDPQGAVHRLSEAPSSEKAGDLGSLSARNLAAVLIHSARYDQAEALLQAGSAMYPTYPDLFYLRGLLCLATGRPREATDFFLKAVCVGEEDMWYVIEPGCGSFKALHAAGRALLVCEDFQQAAHAWIGALTRNPYYVPVLEDLAEVDVFRGVAEQFINALEFILDPRDRDAMLALADFARVSGRTDLAERILSHVPGP